MTKMKEVDAKTCTVVVYVAGDLFAAKQLCRKFCFDVGLCVTVTETEFVYTGGQERGVAVGLVNYPRFPKAADQVFDTAERLAKYLIEGLCEQSALVVAPTITRWITRRPEDLRA